MRSEPKWQSRATAQRNGGRSGSKCVPRRYAPTDGQTNPHTYNTHTRTQIGYTNKKLGGQTHHTNCHFLTIPPSLDYVVLDIYTHIHAHKYSIHMFTQRRNTKTLNSIIGTHTNTQSTQALTPSASK
jgi:hypothetical protein